MAERALCGEILVKRSGVARAAIERGLLEQAKLGLPLFSTMFRLGWVEEPVLIAALSEQLGVPGVDLGASVIAASTLSLVPFEVARSHRILPLALRDRALELAVADPEQRSVLDEISFATGREVLPCVALRVSLESAIEEAYAARKRGEELWRGRRAESNELRSVLIHPGPSRSQVSFESALPEVAAPLDAEHVEPRREGGPPLVLAVDDEEAILDLIERALGHRGIEVVRAGRGRQALELLQTRNPDLVLLDAMLPEIHGFEICSQIKASERYRHTPVIIISAIYTGWNFAQDVKRLYGADEYLAKPFKVVELVRRVEEMLERTKARPRAPDLQQARREALKEAKRAAELYQGGQSEPALEAAQRAVGADPFDARAHFMLGTIHHGMGQIYQAISEFERVVELAPGMFPAVKNLAILYERQGFRAKAVEMWTRALDHSPSDAVRQTIKAHLIGLL